ncbi:uncharacterized protein LTR77_007846 [Saxophila tyrrhenica]|uniref:Uncharacterized protein n=1 Tax=Saxophila tyrrhenica TaxID=1690608 RepID=A0AAV9P3P4_9PEZI|nr:hypothetical protein LTR77_007846 [Saxophila tyrrhenica]
MLPPSQLRRGVVLAHHRALATNTLKASSASLLHCPLSIGQSRRTFWGGRRPPKDWTSHLDPQFQRFHRFRTLKTRAKLLSKIRRHRSFDWDSNAANFFTPRQVRWASRWNDNGWKQKHPWYLNDDGELVKKKSGRRELDGETDGYELNAREKEWQRKLELMRERIDNDPYEALFGKRFEQFWQPLMPNWMKSNFDVTNWGTNEAEARKAADVNQKAESATPKDTAPTKKSQPSTRPDGSQATKGTNAGVEPSEPKKPKPNSYAYASSTTWDSQSNKTKRTEWDSVSGQTKKFEYDPISNRMILVESPKPAETKALESPSKPTSTSSNVVKSSPTPETTVVQNTTGAPGKQTQNTQSSSKVDGVPVKQPNDERKSIPIPPPLSMPSYNVPIGFSPKPTSLGPWKSTAVASDVPKPSSLATIPTKEPSKQAMTETSGQTKQEEANLDGLTAESIRAGFPKLTSTKQPPSASRPPATNPQQQGEQEASFTNLETQGLTDIILADQSVVDYSKLRSYSNATGSQWDQAEQEDILQKEFEGLNKKKEKLLRDEHGLFHIEHQKGELMKLNQRIEEVGKRIDRISDVMGPPEKSSKVAPDNTATKQNEKKPVLQSSLDRMYSKQEDKSQVLQSSLDRMQSKQQISKKLSEEALEDADDAAAHESTEPLETSASKPAVPQGWDKQAEILQADRVKRTEAKVPYPDMQSLITSAPVRKNGQDEINRENRTMNHSLDNYIKKLRATHRVPALPSEATEAAFQERCAEVKKASEPILDQSREHKMGMDQRRKKVKATRSDAEHSQKQPTSPPTLPPAPRIGDHLKQEDHTAERTAKLEKANRMLQDEVQEQKARMEAHEGKYTRKISSLRGELDVAYKQSAVHGDKHVERIRALEKEVEEATKAAPESKYVDKIRALRDELDVAYKQSAVHGEKHVERIRTLEKELAEARKSGAISAAAAAQVADAETKPAAADIPQAEGDLAPNALKFAGSEKWYKQPAVTPSTIKREMEKADQKRRDRELVREVQKIYERFYGTIDTQHRQPEPRKERNVEVESDVDLGEALAKYETDQKQSYRFRKGEMEKEVAAKEREANEGVRLVDDGAPRLIPDALAKASSPAVDAASGAVESEKLWAEPALYKVLTPEEFDRDERKWSMSTISMTSNFTGTEEPVSIVGALKTSKLRLKYLKNIAEQHADGLQLVHAAKKLLVFRKVKDEKRQLGQQDRGLLDYQVVLSKGGSIEVYSLVSRFAGDEAPISITKALGPLNEPSEFMPYVEEYQGKGYKVVHAVHNMLVFRKELPVEKEEAGFGLQDHGLLPATEGGQSTGHSINPIDGTSSLSPGSTSTSEHSTKLQQAEQFERQDYDIRHYPRVKRDEYPVFTGTKRVNQGKTSKGEKSEGPKESKEEGPSVAWGAASGMFGAAMAGMGGAYLVGAAGEKNRKHREKVDAMVQGRRERQVATESAKRREGWFWRE